MATSTNSQRGSKKRKKTFLQNARGMGKKHNFGGGTSLDEDTYTYFVRVLELLQGSFESPEEKVALVENVLVQTEGHEIDYSSNQVGCRVIESLVKSAPSRALLPFMEAFGSKLRIVTTNRFASHVLQALLACVTKVGLDKLTSPICKSDNIEAEKDDELNSEMCVSWVSKVSKFILNNFEEFVWDEYANHVIRTVLACLSGSPPVDTESNWLSNARGSKVRDNTSTKFIGASSKAMCSDIKTEEAHSTIPSEFRSILKEYFIAVTSFQQFTELAYNNLTSALLQALLDALATSRPKLKKKLIKQLITISFIRAKSEKGNEDNSQQVAPIFTTNASIRLLEATVEHSTEDQCSEIYFQCFKGCLIDLSCDLSTNFAVQCLLSRYSNKEEFEEIFEELSPGFKKVIESGTCGVLVSLCNACKRLTSCQWNFIENLMCALHCWEPVERRILLIPLAARLCTYEDFQSNHSEVATAAPAAKDGVVKSNINLHGSLILQSMLSFTKPIIIVKSLLNVSGSELTSMMCDTKGSHIIDAFLKSEYVGEKNRDLLLQRLSGFFPKLAISKHGSRSLEVLLVASSAKNRLKIMDELATKADLVRSSNFGKIVASKWLLDLFRSRRNDWISFQSRKESTKEMFSKIIGKS